MKKILKTGFALSILLTGLNANCISKSCSDVTVDRLYLTDDGRIIVGTSGDESKLSCTSPVGKYLTLRRDALGRNSIYSLLLTAQTTNKSVDIAIKESSSDCRILVAALEK